MDDLHEALSAVRRDLRRVEDEQATLNRKKASNDDVEEVAKKQSAMETDWRERHGALSSEMHSISQNIKRLADGVEAISEELTRHKRKTTAELEALAEPAPDVKRKGAKAEEPAPPPRDAKPFLPPQLQITLYILAGVGLMALIQNAPAAMETLPRFGLGG